MSGAQLREFGAKYVHALRSRAVTAERITDKMPVNFLHAGLIHLALHNAQNHARPRDIRDVALSCFSIMFAAGQYHTYDLVELGRHIRAYQTLMQHWRDVLPAGAMLEVDYEQVVGDLEGNARRITTLRIQWDNACLAFHKSKRPLQTASVLPGPPTNLQLGWPLARIPEPVEAASRGAARAVPVELPIGGKPIPPPKLTSYIDNADQR